MRLKAEEFFNIVKTWIPTDDKVKIPENETRQATTCFALFDSICSCGNFSEMKTRFSKLCGLMENMRITSHELQKFLRYWDSWKANPDSKR